MGPERGRSIAPRPTCGRSTRTASSINWTIVESKQGLANLKAIAAVPGIGVLWPGAGTLRGVFTTTSASGERVFDQAGWEAAIQQVLAHLQGVQDRLRLPGQRE